MTNGGKQGQTKMYICRNCGCDAAQARADARVLGFQEEFQTGRYGCCQVVAWADEQWLAWAEAACEDGKLAEEVTKLLELEPNEEQDEARLK